MRTRLKSLKQLSARLSEESNRVVDSVVSNLSGLEKCHLVHTIAYLSDQQFDLLVSRMQVLTPDELLFGTKILAGLHPDPYAHGIFRHLPKAARKERKPVDLGPGQWSEEWKALQKRVHALLPELFQAIKVMTLDAAFLADIFPHEGDGAKLYRGRLNRDINVKALGLIDRTTKQQYAHRVWTENLWVISQGDQGATTDFIYRSFRGGIWPEDQLRSKIKRVHLAFSREDLNVSVEFVTRMVDLLVLRWGYWDKWLLFMGFGDESNDIAEDLCGLWEDKARPLFDLELKELILDFNDALGPDGTFLGERLASCLPEFRFGNIPTVLTIEAPTSDLADAIRQIIVDRNAEFRRTHMRWW